MTDIATLSVQRSSLPSFPGATLADQLINGRDAALAVLRKYVPNLSYDPDAASLTMRQVGAWEERNSGALETLLQDPNAESVPDAIRIALGNEQAKSFLVAGFTMAAIGLGPWVSGGLDRAVAASQPGDTLQVRWAEEDASARLAVFGTLVKMEANGHLAMFFVPPQSSLGFLPIAIEGATIVWAIVITLVVSAALVLGYMYMSKRLELNNKLMDDLCKSGDQKTKEECVRQAAGLQDLGVGSFLSNLATVAFVLGGGYLALTFLPDLIKKARK